MCIAGAAAARAVLVHVVLCRVGHRRRRDVLSAARVRRGDLEVVLVVVNSCLHVARNGMPVSAHGDRRRRDMLARALSGARGRNVGGGTRC